jgi:hypothetical protein
MPENEFEKKVSSEMQELKFKPSEAVWLRVEERIRRKNKRRVFVIIFLLAGLALPGYWQWDNFFGGKKSEIVKTENTPLEKNNTVNDNENEKEQTDITNNTQKEKTHVTNGNNEEKGILNNDNSINKTDKRSPEFDIPGKTKVDKKRTVLPVDQVKKDPKKNKKDPKPAQGKEVTLTESDLAILTIDEPQTTKKETATKKNIDNNIVNQDVDQINKPSTKVDSIKADTIVKKADIKKDSLVKKIDSVSKIVAVDSPIVNIPKNPSDKKWSFGIEFIPGKSSLKEDLFSFSMNKSADLSANTGSGSGIVPAGPVKSSSGFAFQFGGFFKRQFTKRSSLTVGLRWAYYTEEFRIGARMFPASQSPAFSQLLNTLGVNSVYDAGGYNFSVVNHYHFIELPVNYIVQLNKSDAHPITLNAGLKVGQMFTSNALVYDTAAGGIYYSSRKQFNKTQFGISTSLNWKVTKKDKFYLAVGPLLDMHLNSLLDNPYDKKKYLLFVGLRTSVIFNSKK